MALAFLRIGELVLLLLDLRLLGRDFLPELLGLRFGACGVLDRIRIWLRGASCDRNEDSQKSEHEKQRDGAAIAPMSYGSNRHRTRMLSHTPPNEKGCRTDAARTASNQEAQQNSMAGTPFGRSVQKLLLLFKSLAAQVGRLVRSSGRLRVDQIVFMAVQRPCSSFHASPSSLHLGPAGAGLHRDGCQPLVYSEKAVLQVDLEGGSRLGRRRPAFPAEPSSACDLRPAL